MPAPPLAVDVDAIERAREAIGDVARPTPVLSSRTLSQRCGGEIVLKAENLQRTGSFKLRGALAKLASLGDRARGGVVTGSAGNHAQSLAYAARAVGVPCEVFMPSDAPISKIEAAAGQGASVHRVPGTVDECVERARRHAEEREMVLVHPFDDPAIVAGQGTLGLELCEQVPDLARVIVPIGGGGLTAGIALAVAARRPEATVVPVGTQAVAPWPASLRDGEPHRAAEALTIADGIAVKQPGQLTLPIVQRHAEPVAAVAEEDIAEAMVHLLERAKLVVEGAGAVGVAALLEGEVAAASHGTTAVVLSGGNVDAGLLAAIARRHETEAGRRLVLLTRVSDRPGGLAELLALVAELEANLVEVEHVREGLDLHVRETAVQLVLETRGREHAAAVLDACEQRGYPVRVLG